MPIKTILRLLFIAGCLFGMIYCAFGVSSPAATRLYCDNNSQRAVTTAVNTVQAALPGLVSNEVSKIDLVSVVVGSTETGAAGTPAMVTNSGSAKHVVLDFRIPRGDNGERGPQGIQGATGMAATVSVGTTTTSEAGGQASVTNSGDSHNAIFNFTIPRGAVGPQGEVGPQGAVGPQGEKGDQGIQGPATINVTNAYALVAGTDPIVENIGNPSNVILRFGIPRGEQGPSTIALTNTVTLPATENAYVTNRGTASDLILEFGIPKGESVNVNGMITDGTNTISANREVCEVQGIVTNRVGTLMLGSEVTNVSEYVAAEYAATNTIPFIYGNAPFLKRDGDKYVVPRIPNDHFSCEIDFPEGKIYSEDDVGLIFENGYSSISIPGGSGDNMYFKTEGGGLSFN